MPVSRLFDATFVFFHKGLVGGRQQYDTFDKSNKGGNIGPAEQQHQYAAFDPAQVEFMSTGAADQKCKQCGDHTALYRQVAVALVLEVYGLLVHRYLPCFGSGTEQCAAIFTLGGATAVGSAAAWTAVCHKNTRSFFFLYSIMDLPKSNTEKQETSS